MNLDRLLSPWQGRGFHEQPEKSGLYGQQEETETKKVENSAAGLKTAGRFQRRGHCTRQKLAGFP